MARAARVRLPHELQAYLEEQGGEDNLAEGWMDAYKHALSRGNVHKGCVLYADAHHGDFAEGGILAPKTPIGVEDDSATTDDD